ncbi:MAG: DMT family transporter [Thermoanaerobaculia bacterium]|nr:DMT family transporter [Thermoanaerobaculia bacterium]
MTEGSESESESERDLVAAEPAFDPTVVGPAATERRSADEERRRNNLVATGIMLIGVASFAVMDATLKALAAHYPPMQVAAMRGLSSLPLIVVWVQLSGGFRQLIEVRFPLHLFRGVLAIGMLASFTFALRYLPLAEAYSIFFAAPLLITAFAVPLLGERVGWRRWGAIVVGMLGVLIVLRPTGEGVLTLAGLAVLFAAIGYALSAIAVRVLGRTDSTVSMVFWLMLILAVGATLLALPRWTPIRSSDWTLILVLAISGSFGQWGITEAFRRGEASAIAPFEYTALAWGSILDFLIWKTLPGPLTFAGAGVIIASGIYLIHRERTGHDRNQRKKVR